MNFYPKTIEAEWARLNLESPWGSAIEFELTDGPRDSLWVKLPPRQAEGLRDRLAALLAEDAPDINPGDTAEFGCRLARVLHDIETRVADGETADVIRDEVRSLIRMAFPSAAGF